MLLNKFCFAAGLAAVPVLFLTASCATYNEAHREADLNFSKSSYNNALSVIESKKKSLYPPKNAVLYRLDKGMLEHYAGLFEESSKDLQEADELIERNFAKSITQAAASYILNDNVKDYGGEEYENIYLNVFNSLNYYHKGDIEGALVEVRRAGEKITSLGDKYAKAIRKARASNEHGASVKVSEKVNFNDSALARYLGAVLYRAAGKEDDARIDFKAIQTAFISSPNVYPFPCPDALIFKEGGDNPEINVPKGAARLNVVAFAGQSPYKEEESIVISLPVISERGALNSFARISLPKLVNRPSSVSGVTISVNGSSFKLDMVEDLGLAAQETFKASYALTVLKSTMRSIIKQTTSAIASDAIGEYNSNLALITSLITSIFNTASEQADIRISRYLPRYAYVGGVTLPPGEYDVKINFSGGEVQEKKVVLKAGALNLIEAFYLK
ncbi:MAG: hypothetical protein LBC53_00970 [Spirochaetaceae bacterium]|jgi:hypothetical protein|nr:hypothetical protein [Spirochaetaceae bacterium]